MIQVLLGHTKLDTTARYTQVATTTIRNVTSPLDHLIGKIKKDDRPPDAQRACRARRWRLRISSATMARHGAVPMPAMSASANSR